MYSSYLLLFYVTILSGRCERPKGARQSLFFTLYEIASFVSLPRNDILADCFLSPEESGWRKRGEDLPCYMENKKLPEYIFLTVHRYSYSSAGKTS